MDESPRASSPAGRGDPLPATASLFEPLTLRSVTLRNRVVVSPMCQYSSHDGMASDWHLVHLGSRAVGGAGAVIVEATAVTPEGRISPQDMGLWKDEQVEPLRRVATFVAAQGAVPGIQIAHAGRKAGVAPPWLGGAAVPLDAGGWVPLGPGEEPFGPAYPRPRAMTPAEIEGVVEAFRSAARRAHRAGFKLLEIHAAHGYLLHEFLSPLVNRRADSYGGSFQNRARLAREVTRAVRQAWPGELPLSVRVSATDWAEGGWDVDECVRLAGLLRDDGADVIDCSSGGAVAHQKIDLRPGYQVPFAARIRREAGVRTAAVGLITEPAQAEAILRGGEADLIVLAREELRSPYWPLHAARALGVDVAWPPQYLRAKPTPG